LGLSEAGVATLGIRPEHLDVVDAGAGSLTGAVVFREALGADTLIHVKLGSGETLIARTDGHGVEAGNSVGLAPRMARLHRFDAQGQRCEATG